MKERGILFSAPMVQALLAGTKTQTRRIAKLDAKTAQTLSQLSAHLGDPVLKLGAGGHGGAVFEDADKHTSVPVRCPYGIAGDRLWVRETWQPLWAGERCPDSLASPDGWKIGYAADKIVEYCDGDGNRTTRCKPGIHMPRWASRITLDITNVRIERLHAITEADAWAEGIASLDGMIDDADICAAAKLANCMATDAKATFAALWESINGERAGWKSNPWVWVVEFKAALRKVVG